MQPSAIILRGVLFQVYNDIMVLPGIICIPNFNIGIIECKFPIRKSLHGISNWPASPSPSQSAPP